jgi:hypothetical protein
LQHKPYDFEGHPHQSLGAHASDCRLDILAFKNTVRKIEASLNSPYLTDLLIIFKFGRQLDATLAFEQLLVQFLCATSKKLLACPTAILPSLKTGQVN